MPLDKFQQSNDEKPREDRGDEGHSIVDQVFEKFKTYVDKRIEGVGSVPAGASTSWAAKDESSLARQLKRETEAQKLKYKSNSKQFLHNAEVEEKLVAVANFIEENDRDGAYESTQEALKLIQKRQKLIKLADKSEGGWLVVQEYESDELADNSEDEKKIKKAQEKGSKKRKQQLQAKAAKKPRYYHAATTARPDDRQLFRGIVT